MGEKELLSQIEETIIPIINDEGFKLWGIILTQVQNQKILRVMIEKSGDHPVNLDDCSTLSRSLEDILAVKDFIASRYFLEVSSPGLDRPLIKFEHYRNYLGQIIKLKTDQPVDNRRNFKGKLTKLDEDKKIIFMEIDGKEHEVFHQDVVKSNLQPEWIKNNKKKF